MTDTLYGVAYGNGTYAAVGVGGRILRSTTGANWTIENSGVSVNLSAINYGNQTFVAVGDAGAILTSSNAINWLNQKFYISNRIVSVAFGNGVFVALGDHVAPGGPFPTPPGRMTELNTYEIKYQKIGLWPPARWSGYIVGH